MQDAPPGVTPPQEASESGHWIESVPGWEWLRENIDWDKFIGINRIGNQTGGELREMDAPFRKQYFTPEEDLLPRTSDRPTGSEGIDGVWRRSNIDYPDLPITESIQHRGSWLGNRNALPTRKPSAHGGINPKPLNPYVPWEAHENPGDPHYGRAIEIPGDSDDVDELRGWGIMKHGTVSVDGPLVTNEFGTGWVPLLDLGGLGVSTRTVGKDPETGEPYLSVFDKWDFGNYDKNRPPLSPFAMDVEGIMSALPGEPYNIYDRMPLEQLAGPLEEGDIARYRFKHHPDRGDKSVYEAGIRPPHFDRTRSEEERQRFRNRGEANTTVGQFVAGLQGDPVERSTLEPLVPGRSEWGFPDDPAARALQVEEALEAVYTEYPGLRIFNIDVQDFRDRAPFSGGGQLEFLASTDQGPETARREDRGNLRQTEGPYAGRFRPTVELFEGVIGQDLAKSIFGDMLHHFSEKDEQGEYIEDRGVAPDFQRLLDDFHDTMYEVDEQTLDYKDDTPEAEAQRRWNDRVYQINVNEYGEGRPFDQWYDASHLDGLVRGFLAPDNNAELLTSRGYPWKGEEEQGWYTERQRGILNQMRNLLRSGGRR
jgi:hypothetical protein